MRGTSSIVLRNPFVNQLSGKSLHRKAKRRLAGATRCGIEAMEARLLLSTYTPSPSAADGAVNSLRYDIIQANSDTQNDTINLKAGTYALSIPNSAGQENSAAEGDLDLTNSAYTLLIQGKGPTKTFINAEQIDRVFQVFPGVTVEFKNLTITGGLAVDDGTAGALPDTTEADGGGILNNGGNVTLYNVTLCGNTAEGGAGVVGPNNTTGSGYGAVGGGLFSEGGTVTFAGSVLVKSNAALGGTGALGISSDFGGFGGYAEGGGLFIAGSGSNSLNCVTIQCNSAVGGGGGAGGGGDVSVAGGYGGNSYGGGIFYEGDFLSFTGSSVTGNNAVGGTGGAGGLANYSVGTNTGGDGGYAAGGGVYSLASVVLCKTDVNCNIAAGGFGGLGGSVIDAGEGGDGGYGGNAEGGGIFVGNGELIGVINMAPPDSTVTLLNCSTVDNNTAEGGNGGVGGIGVENLPGPNVASTKPTVGPSDGAGGDGGYGSGGGIFVAMPGAQIGWSVLQTAVTPTVAPVMPAYFVVVNDSSVDSNQALGGTGGTGNLGGDGGDAAGGGIFAGPDPSVIDTSTDVAPAVPVIAPSGSVSLCNSQVNCNQATGGNGAVSDGSGGSAFGGGIAASEGVSLYCSSVSNNCATGGNGGIETVLSLGINQAPGNITVISVPVGSSGAAQGGGIYDINETFCQVAAVLTPDELLGGDLSLVNSCVSSNKAIGGKGAAGGGSGDASGGGIYTDLDVSICGSNVSCNSAIGGMGYGTDADGGQAMGGGIFTVNIICVSGCSSISNNSAIGGNGAPATADTSAGNGEEAEGGGIFSLSTITLNHSTVSGNSAIAGNGGLGANNTYGGGDAGGAAGGGLYCDVDVDATNSTISHNTAKGGLGGNGASGSPDGGIAGDGGSATGGAVDAGGNITLTNTNVFSNTAIGGRGGKGGKGTTLGGNGGDGGYASGGGLYTTGTITLLGSSSQTNNTATPGKGGAGGNPGGTPGTNGA